MTPGCTYTDDGSPTCYCPVSSMIEVLGRKYSIQILCILAAHGPARFGVVEDHLPTASTSTLSPRLDDLAEQDLVTREQHDEIPPRVEYELTGAGRSARDSSRCSSGPRTVPARTVTRARDDIQKEMQRCIVLCANCHRRAHFETPERVDRRTESPEHDNHK